MSDYTPVNGAFDTLDNIIEKMQARTGLYKADDEKVDDTVAEAPDDKEEAGEGSMDEVGEDEAPLNGSQNSAVADALQKSLVDVLATALITHQGHWVAKGVGFHPLHMLLGSIYDTVNDMADPIAERMSQLDVAPAGQPSDVAGSSIKALPNGFVECEQVIRGVSEALDALNVTLRNAHNDVQGKDPVTENMFQDWIAVIDKQIWLLSFNLPMNNGMTATHNK